MLWSAGVLRATPLSSPALFGRSLSPYPVHCHARLPPFAVSPSQLPAEIDWARYRVGALDSVFYLPDFFSEADEQAIMPQLAASPPELWRQMAGRRVQECGSRMADSGAGLVLEELPPWVQRVCERLLAHGVFPAATPPNSVALNQYSPTEGIAPHADGPIYIPRVAILSLGSPAVFRFYGRQPELGRHIEWNPETDTPRHEARGPPIETILLQPRSLLLFRGAAFREHCHEVAALADGVEVLGEVSPGHRRRCRCRCRRCRLDRRLDRLDRLDRTPLLASRACCPPPVLLQPRSCRSPLLSTTWTCCSQAAPLVNGELAGACEGEQIVRQRRTSLTIRHIGEFLLAPEAYRIEAR